MYFGLCFKGRSWIVAGASALALSACGDSFSGGTDFGNGAATTVSEDVGGGTSGGLSEATSGSSASPTSGQSGSSDTNVEPQGSTSDDTAGSSTSSSIDVENYCLCEPDVHCGAGVCRQFCDGPPPPDMPAYFCACAGETQKFPGDPVLPGDFLCLECTDSSGDLGRELDVQVISGRVTPEFTDDELDADNDAELYLFNPFSGDRVPLSRVSAVGYQTRVLSGVYDMVYAVKHNQGGALPSNSFAALGRVAVPANVEGVGDDDLVLETELSSITITASLTLNQGPLPNTEDDHGRVLLRNAMSGDELVIASTLQPSFTVRVVDGVYELIYESLNAGAGTPANPRVTIAEVSSAALETAESVDIPMVTISGEFRFNGALAPDTEDDHGALYLRADGTEQLIPLGSTTEGSYTVNLVPADYDVIYAPLNPGAKAPRNELAVVDRFQKDELASPKHIDIPTVTISGAYMINGAPAPLDATDDGTVRLESVADSAVDLGVVRLGATSEGVFEDVVVIPGAYEIFYAQETAGGTAPQNTHARVGGPVDVAGDGPLSVNIPTITISGDLSLDGGAPQLDGFEDARVFLRDAETGDSVLLGSLSQGSFSSKVVVPGTYDVHYSLEAGGANLPVNLDAKIAEGLELNVDVDIPINVESVLLSGEFTFNGQSGADEGSYGLFYLVDQGTGDELYVGNTHLGVSGVRVVPGRYDLRYRHAYSSSPADAIVPQNRDAALGCVELH